jgi:poly-beta-hydroxyalkanoate depolymerase
MRLRYFAAAAVAAAALAGCGSNADTVSKNISKEAEKFNVQRRIVAINGITDKPLFMVEGKCSIEGDNLGGLKAMQVICKHGPNDYRKHYITVPDNVATVTTQIGGVSVSEYRTKIIFRPTSIVPDLDLMVGS